ncbi:T9SS type A sorting domain-containing protein [Sunxiuqinia elliptica]|uniref:Por secretion system C-terminal sorting domain-containing protein n=1 Tax=Sunxiuqinia elliptica TaxID=655355 RepID=A0A1I2KMG3_9BACT|nr:T9SS type A sorting domain-containing protein [Sunxiuqinia elliptica]SFF67519.1 Por secretion system C-terminal sorting domain-containing protein [Sunxiuqinia elliptica]
MKRIYLIIISLAMVFSLANGQTKTVNVEIDFTSPGYVSKYRAGLTHTQKSIDSWGNPAAISKAKLLLDSVAHFQNQHLMGWGALNPWPDSTVVDSEEWNWESLDNRINLIRETNGEAVITLCACPSWMHNPSKNGETDWNAIEEAPTPDHYDDFAHLCAETARRYPDVRYFQVWNEFKGFYDVSKNRWGYETFTDMYNMVYDSLKAVNPDLLIGGPYMPMDSWSSSSFSHPSNLRGVYGVVDQRALDGIKYWLTNKRGGQFITVDGGNDNKDGIWKNDSFKAAQKFVDIINWIRQQPGGEDLPVWWSEWYAWPQDTYLKNKAEYRNAIMAAGLIKSIMAGYANLMIWQPQGNTQGFSYPLGVWTDTEIAGGGQPTLFYETQKGLHNFFSEGTEIYKTTTSTADVVSVMVCDTAILLVNKLYESVKVNIEGMDGELVLAPNEVRFIVDYDITTSVKIIKQEEDFQVYPNPVKDKLFITPACSGNSPYRVELYSMTGNKVMSENAPVLPLDLSALACGTYLLKIIGNNTNCEKILIKN